MGDLTERCAVLERERAGLYMRHTGLLEEIRELRAYKKATARRLAALERREAPLATTLVHARHAVGPQ